MELVLGLVALVALVILLMALVWRPARGRRRTADEAIESDALRREQEKNLTDATYSGDRWQIRTRK